ncbi:hypothetical protein CKO08_08950 [Halorhodospira halochloris]|nr:hypothetical protein [Halorhodospira halochloris]
MAMATLIVGLVLFLGAHSSRLLVPGWRAVQIERLGEQRWKGMMALTSLAGLVLLVIGYSLSYPEQNPLWAAPAWLDPILGTLMLFSFILVAAAFVRGSQIHHRLGHPLVAGVAVWALVHLIATGGRPADLALYGLFMLWASAEFISLRRRDLAAGASFSDGRMALDGVAIFAGLVAYLAFVFFLHHFLFGVPAFR